MAAVQPAVPPDAPGPADPAGTRDGGVSPYVDFTREEWARLRAATPLTLTEADLEALREGSEHLDLAEVVDVYLPLSRLLNLRVAATHDLHATAATFLGLPRAPSPYVIAIAGSVSVGKSTIARVLQALLARWPNHPRVDLVTTDGFLYPNDVLEARGLMARKGFPASYDVRRLIRFLAELKAGGEEVRAPRYSHVTYDVVPGDEQVVVRPDIVVVEGLNLLQAPAARPGYEPAVVVSDFLDFSIYVDADEADVREWFVQRFLALRAAAASDPASFFHHFTRYSDEEARRIAEATWDEINGVNLRENIAPTRNRAHLVLEKGSDHTVRRIRLRKL